MNHTFKRLLTLCFSLLMVFSLGFQGLPAPLPTGPDWRAKVDPWTLSEAAQGETEFLLLLSEQADLSSAARLQTKTEKG
ncbi:MAG TPA: hypothetical protein VLS48_02925, partial [Anaerolineales bacterium]|nr:hypothetical protein [Anaerolineales bacterium]